MWVLLWAMAVNLKLVVLLLEGKRIIFFFFFSFRLRRITIFLCVAACFDLPRLLKTDQERVKCDILHNNNEPVILYLKQ